jgi:hypothetical protein
MEIDKQQVVEQVASSVWNAADPLGMKGALETQDKMVQFNLKNTVMPSVLHTLPIAEKHIKDKIRGIIATGHAIGLDADMILHDINLELGE